MKQRYPGETCRPVRPVTPVYPEGLELAQAYILNQRYSKSYCPEEALEKGTMFPELYRPYGGKGNKCR